MLYGSDIDSVGCRGNIAGSYLNLDNLRVVAIVILIGDRDVRNGDCTALEGGIGCEGNLQHILGVCVEEQSFAMVNGKGVGFLVVCNGRLHVLLFFFVPHDLLGLGFCHRQTCRQVEIALEGLDAVSVLHEFQGNLLACSGLDGEVGHGDGRLLGGLRTDIVASYLDLDILGVEAIVVLVRDRDV